MFTLAALGTTEWIVIALVVVLLFGARKMPELARSLGTSVVEFKRGLKEPQRSATTEQPSVNEPPKA